MRAAAVNICFSSARFGDGAIRVLAGRDRRVNINFKVSGLGVGIFYNFSTFNTFLGVKDLEFEPCGQFH